MKMKIRGQSSQNDIPQHTSETEHDQENTSQAHTRSTITVSKKAQRAFAALFRVPSAYALPGELPRTDFVHGMSSIGFMLQKIQGPAWLFAPINRALNRSIMFYEPHPESKIPSQWARRITRRLNALLAGPQKHFQSMEAFAIGNHLVRESFMAGGRLGKRRHVPNIARSHTGPFPRATRTASSSSLPHSLSRSVW